jgi:hypothetical protein
MLELRYYNYKRPVPFARSPINWDNHNPRTAVLANREISPRKQSLLSFANDANRIIEALAQVRVASKLRQPK